MNAYFKIMIKIQEVRVSIMELCSLGFRSIRLASTPLEKIKSRVMFRMYRRDLQVRSFKYINSHLLLHD